LKFLLEGAFGESNFGDDLLMLATLNALIAKWPDAQITINARQDSKRNDYLDRVPGIHRILRGWLLSFEKYDLKIFAGGTQFYSYPKIKNKAKKYWFEIFFNKIGNKLLRIWHQNRKNAYLGIGIGPFYDGNLEACKKLILKGSFIAVRDGVSADYLENWGAVNFNCGADICYQRDWWFDSKANISKTEEKDIIGIVVRDFDYDLPGRDYLEPLVSFIESLLSSGKKVKCFAFSRIKDAGAILRISELGVDILVWNGEFDELNEYLKQISSCMLLISARYHGVVIGSVLGIPSIGIEVDPKVKLACDSLGEGSLCWSAPFSLAELEDKCAQLLERREAALASLVTQTAYLKHKTQKMFDAFVNFVETDVKHE